MCGIAGVLGTTGDRAIIGRMTQTMIHRGPDDGGCWVGAHAALGMRRLSIIDLSGGTQPMLTPDGRHVLVYNGEIYNYRELRAELRSEGASFWTDSDTEVILHGVVQHGPAFIERLRGMFAFALHDALEGTTLIARDRLGVKPLYIARTGGRIIFASEIKSLLDHPEFQVQPDLAAVSDYLALRYVPGPGSLFAGVEKFPPATWMLHRSDGSADLHRYWRAPTQGPDWGIDEANERFAALFDEATRVRMVAERPVGAFLSGGTDSTAIVASLRRQFATPLRTFCVGFDWEGDELGEARAMAARLGCDHDEVVVRSEDCALLPTICRHLDEPVGDAIVLPMFLVSRLARQHVTVVQSGEGADEMLAGYFMHRAFMKVDRYTRIVPEAVTQSIVLPLLRLLPKGLLNAAFDYPGTLGDRGKRKLTNYVAAAAGMSDMERYRGLMSLFDDADQNDLMLPEMKNAVRRRASAEIGKIGGDLNVLLATQFDSWLPDDILMKQDKMTMANSIEGRVPFLDHHLVEFLTPLARRHKLGGGRNKVILREYLRRVVGPDAARRRKKAFYMPIDRYLRQGPLKEIVETLLCETSVRRRGLFRWDSVRALRSAGTEEGFLVGKQVFSLAMLELWFRIFIDRESGWQ
jgi:asparagine synthase (glutamine-hydrolysing)